MLQRQEVEVILVAKSHHKTVAFLCLYTTINSHFYTALIHTALGGGGPSWQPLIVAVVMSQW
jgi:hypothetical protein